MGLRRPGIRAWAALAMLALHGQARAAEPCGAFQPRETVAFEAGFHVAVHGSDDADGSPARPFATLERARLAMQGSQARTTFVHDGDHVLAAPLTLGPADSGTAFVAATGGGPVIRAGDNGAHVLLLVRDAHAVVLEGLVLHGGGARIPALVLERGSHHRVAGNSVTEAGTGIVLAGSQCNQVLNNAIIDSADSAIEAKDGSDGNVFDSNSIDGTGGPATHGGGFFLHGASHNLITRNLVRNTVGMGIGIANWDGATINVGNVVAGNVVGNTNMRSMDSGAIYILGRSHVDTRTVVAGNLIDGTGAGGDAHTIGIYLDDSTSGVLVHDNVVVNLGTHAVQVHGGDDNTITRNLFDLAAGGMSAILFQAAPADTNPRNTMLRNVVAGNVVLAAGQGQTAYGDLNGGVPEIAGNLYVGLAPEHVAEGRAIDRAPVFGRRGEDRPGFGPCAAGPGWLGPQPMTARGPGWPGFQPLPARWTMQPVNCSRAPARSLRRAGPRPGRP